jgi:hypothetical protein
VTDCVSLCVSLCGYVFVQCRRHLDQTALLAEANTMRRTDTSSESADSDILQEQKTKPEKTVPARIDTSSASASADERPQGRGNRGRAPDVAEEVSEVATVVAEVPGQPDQLKAAHRLRIFVSLPSPRKQLEGIQRRIAL